MIRPRPRTPKHRRHRNRSRVSVSHRCCRVALALLLSSGCASTPSRPNARLPQALPTELAAYYEYPEHARQSTQRLVKERQNFREFLVQFPFSTPGFEPTEPVVEFEWMESKKPGRRAAILVNPILGGDYPLERAICRAFAEQGFHVALIHRKTLKISPEHDLSHLELLLRQGILRIRQVVDWMTAQPQVDPQRIGSFGISMGGMASVIAAAVEPRLRVHVIALAGGSLPEILITSKDRLLTKPRRRYLAAHHMELEVLRRLLQEHVKTDPLLMAPYVDPQRLFMFIALSDRTIGRANALRLWRALDHPRAVFLPTGHYTTYLLLPYLKYESLRFFADRLK